MIFRQPRCTILTPKPLLPLTWCPIIEPPSSSASIRTRRPNHHRTDFGLCCTWPVLPRPLALRHVPIDRAKGSESPSNPTRSKDVPRSNWSRTSDRPIWSPEARRSRYNWNTPGSPWSSPAIAWPGLAPCSWRQQLRTNHGIEALPEPTSSRLPTGHGCSDTPPWRWKSRDGLCVARSAGPQWSPVHTSRATFPKSPAPAEAYTRSRCPATPRSCVCGTTPRGTKRWSWPGWQKRCTAPVPRGTNCHALRGRWWWSMPTNSPATSLCRKSRGSTMTRTTAAPRNQTRWSWWPGYGCTSWWACRRRCTPHSRSGGNLRLRSIAPGWVGPPPEPRSGASARTGCRTPSAPISDGPRAGRTGLTLASRLLMEQAHSKPLGSPLQLANIMLSNVLCMVQRGHFRELKLSLFCRNSLTTTLDPMCHMYAFSWLNEYSAPIDNTASKSDGATWLGRNDSGCKKGRWWWKWLK